MACHIQMSLDLYHSSTLNLHNKVVAKIWALELCLNITLFLIVKPTAISLIANYIDKQERDVLIREILAVGPTHWHHRSVAMADLSLSSMVSEVPFCP